jgi:branched-chain amino acid transport system substrate-binding protein
VKIKKQWILLLVVALFALTAVGCFGGQDTGNQNQGTDVTFEGEIPIGVMLPMTGGMASFGEDMFSAIQIAADEINAAGGILGKRVVLVQADDAGDPATAVNAATMLVSQEVVAVVGGYSSGAVLPTLNIYRDARIPMVIAAANSTMIAGENVVGDNPGWAFQLNSSGDHQADKAVGWFDHLGAERIALVHMGDAFSANLAHLTRDLWEDRNGEVVAYHVISEGQQDFSAIVTSIRAANPDVIYWTAYYSEGAPFIMQLRQGGFQGAIVVADGSASVRLLEIAGAASEGIYSTAPPVVDFIPAAQGFITAYEARFRRSPGAFDGLAYDSMRLMADAIERAGSVDPEAIRQALADTDNFPALAGPVRFTDRNTLAESNFIILRAEGGSWVLVD